MSANNLGGAGIGTQGRGSSSESFPDPFCDMASLAMPDTIQDALRWCEYVFMANGTYRAAIDRVISYFITDIEIGDDDTSKETKEQYNDFLHDTLGIQTVLHTVALDYLCYGNSFTSLNIPFRRYLMCKSPDCRIEFPLKRVYNGPEFNFKWQNFQFTATCPKCGTTGEWDHIDRRSGEESNICVKRWSPHDMELLWDPYSDELAYIWKIPNDYKKMIREGHLHQLERANWEIVESVRNDNFLLFDKEVIYHMRENALSGIRNRGWGISRVLANFRQVWYVQVLHRYNEAIALDYVIPFRVITPEPRAGADPQINDPAIGANLSSFVSRVNWMVKRRRRDPATWNVLPFPIRYQALGGDATQLAPRELLDQGLDTLLNATGVPVDLYKGSLQLQSAPTALRLFESNWSHLVHNLNKFLSTLVSQIARVMGWDPVTATLQRVTHADDLNRQMAKLQLMMGRQISQTSGLQSMGMDYEREQKRILEEEEFLAEQQQEMQERQEQAGMMDAMAPTPMQQMQGGDPAAAGGMPPPGGAPPAGGDPAAAGGDPAAAGMAPGGAAGMQSITALAQMGENTPITPQDMMGRAQAIAQQLMMMPESQKDSELRNLKGINPTLHSLVGSIMDDMRNQARMQGGAMLMGQAGMPR